MKAEDLKKKERSIESIHKEIQDANERGDYRILCHPHQYISNSTVLQLISDGFKCYYVKDYLGLEALIIEW